MDNVEYKGNWEDQKRRIKEKLELLTRNGLLVEDKREEMIEKLQLKLGISKDELRKIVNGF